MVSPRRWALALSVSVQSPLRTLDTTHSLLVYTSIWIYLITNYGDEMKIDTIPMYVCDFAVLHRHSQSSFSPLAVCRLHPDLSHFSRLIFILVDRYNYRECNPSILLCNFPTTAVQAFLTFIVHWYYVSQDATWLVS